MIHLAEKLKIIPLGGLDEIGKNCTVLEYGKDMIVIDCGVGFPEEDMYGVDLVIPDFTYLVANQKKLRGMFITHGHEDHIGSIPYAMRDVNCPIHGTSMTCGLIKLKLEEHRLADKVKLVTHKPGDVVKAGCFTVEFIHVNHSIPDAVAFAIRTPVGTVIFTGDFKIDPTSHDGMMDLARLGELGNQGVLAMLADSTNVERQGYTPSENVVADSLDRQFRNCDQRIIVTTFASNMHRIQSILSTAQRYGRKVAVSGRSMENMLKVAQELGYLKVKPGTIVDLASIKSLPKNKIVIVSTGSQGEPMSALTRIAFSNHREIEIQPGDTVIISATPIPGNEKPIYKVINELYRRGAKVYYSALADVHVSGHASQEEIKLVHALVRPKFFIPAHGETRMLYQHAELAHKLGVPFENIFILANGDIFEISKGSARVTGFTNGDAVLIDGASVGEVDNSVLRERKLLSDDGVVAISLAVNRKTGAMMAQPVVSAMGFLYDSEHVKIEAACRQHAANAVARIAASGKKVQEAVSSGQLQGQLRSFLYERTKRRPVVMINLIEVDS